MKGPDLFLYRLWYSPDIEDTNSAAFFMLGYGSDFGSTFEERGGKRGQSNYS